MEIPRFSTVGQYHDAWAWIILSAPDEFSSFDGKPADQRKELDRAFADLREGFHLAEKKLKDPRLIRVCRELIEMSYEAYVAGDSKIGAHSLQECEGLIWPGRRLPAKHAVEAERRAFGELQLFANVQVSRYPYEGTYDDLGPTQQRLLAHAAESCLSRLREDQGFLAVWTAHSDGAIREVRARSQKQAREFIRAGATSGAIIGAGSAQLLPGGGLLVYHLEEPGRPLIAVMNLRRNGAFEPPRYHLNDPVTFVHPAMPSGSPESEA
jgi:hypothetical protein